MTITWRCKKNFVHCLGLSIFDVFVALPAFVLLTELLATDIDKPRECMIFLHTPTIGNLILTGLVVDTIVQRVVEGNPL
ncbi:hypothetical protein DFS33DRAFT_1360273 [Desarmillaria ectypa]|nr:hypothetical protein DFS33DRAFT_1360273 [Desarmillaria ectypa]